MKKWHPQSRRLFGAKLRPRSMIIIVFAMLAAYYLLFAPSTSIQVVPSNPNVPASPPPPVTGNGEPDTEDQYGAIHRELWELTAQDLKDWHDPTDGEDPNDIEPGFETDGKERGFGDLGKLQHEKDMRKEWRHAYSVTSNFPHSNLIYGKTLANLENQEDRPEEFSVDLKFDPDADVEYSSEKPVRYDPYPKYNSAAWKDAGYAQYFPCKGATGELVEDLLVFKGRPREWPLPRFGSYDALNMDPNLCWERETRLGPYGLHRQFKKVGGEPQPLNFDNVNWGDLQRMCLHKNAQRFDMNRERVNEYLNMYPETVIGPQLPEEPQQAQEPAPARLAKRDAPLEPEPKSTPDSTNPGAQPALANPEAISQVASPQKHPRSPRNPTTGYFSEPRTAILLRSYTGKDYTENDKQNIRSLISELSLKTGGQYEVFLLVQVKDTNLRIFEDDDVYQTVLSQSVPPEFRSMTILWNDDVVWKLYPKLTDPESKNVHTAQWLSVQKFSQDYPQFDFVWNWEMDFRFTGHHYHLLDKLGEFAKKQPRKGMWERNERWYIPTFHGGYDDEFRKDIEKRYGDNTIWGAPEFPFINPIGPKPPVSSPSQDNYEWGVGEEADVVTVSPMFNPINSNWVIANQVWGYNDSTHKSQDIPRRTTIVTQSRVSKKLLNIMHVENLRGNHVASEMTPQTVALLHGLKAVYAPHPVFMDRDWKGKFLNKWFNPGENGECGGRGSPMGWGRERRYIGSTWYYRAIPPNRLYNNWMGWHDTGIGGPQWEEKHGRPCLPPIMLHQVKNTEPTSDNHETTFELAYG
ncbi:major facilitator superfamily transporter [Fusarium pseudoanthophilum]|uniref:Major facilitator superfamily transporter n=1 Tax=Fusarium pseudoanthophilum TaxID=48495 RepID=A0A8H5P787_9HYPO|nr:major facilitator superfamily transporter [Fusarium pseudoanthophilum]